MRPPHITHELALALLFLLPLSTALSPPPPFTAHLSPDLQILYLLSPPTPHTPTYTLSHLPLNSTFSSTNITHSLVPLPVPPIPPTDTAALLLLAPSALTLLSGSCTTTLKILDLPPNAPSWNARALAPSARMSPISLRPGAAAFAYSDSSTTSTVAPSSTFMTGSGEAAMKEFEQGVVITTATASTAYVFGGVCEGMYSAALLAAEFPVVRTQSYVPGGKSKDSKAKPAPAPAAQDPGVALSEYDGGSSREWPIPEAGFSMTMLPRAREGAGGMSVVMVGGHTAGAFVDMRQVAVYSAPDGRWRFADVGLPAASPPRLQSSETRVLAAAGVGVGAIVSTTREDPSTRGSSSSTTMKRNDDTRRIDPRSGHSAVATRDGKRIVVYGGWVGDINTPAEPRLIILEMRGEAGTDQWSWTIPFIHPGDLGPPTDGEAEGLAGHAAVMLDGDVMLITGGYRISPFSPDSVVSGKSYFFNVTSGMWAASYKPLSVQNSEAAAVAVRKSEHRRTTSIVLGVVFGIAGLVAAIIGYHWYFRKGRRERDAENAGPLERERWGSFGFYGGPSGSEERLGEFNCYGTGTEKAAERPMSIYTNGGRPSMSQERLGIYAASRASISQERVGIVETRSHSYRVLGEDATAVPEPSIDSPPRPQLRKMPYMTSAAVPGVRPPPKAVLKTNPARVSTIFEAEENPFDPNRASRGSSCAATTGSDDLANLQSLYSRSLAFAEKMAEQEVIYEQSRSRSRSTTLSGEWSDQTSSLRVPPRAALSSESLSLVPTAPIRIPYTRSFPPRSVARPSPPRPRVKTLLTPARFFPEQKQRRVVSLHQEASDAPPTPAPKRWASISALRSALPDILPTSPISLWETGSKFSRNSSNTTGDTVEMPTNRSLDEALVDMRLDELRVGGDDEWDLELEAAIEKRVVQVLFTAPKGALRVVNLDERVPEVPKVVVEDVEVEMEKAPVKMELKVVIPEVEEKVFEEKEEVPEIGEGVLEMICQ